MYCIILIFILILILILILIPQIAVRMGFSVFVRELIRTWRTCPGKQLGACFVPERKKSPVNVRFVLFPSTKAQDTSCFLCPREQKRSKRNTVLVPEDNRIVNVMFVVCPRAQQRRKRIVFFVPCIENKINVMFFLSPAQNP